MAIEVLLLNNVKNVGKVGEVVNVRDGYARNFLLPQGLATKVTKSALRQIEAHKAKIQKEYEEAVAAAQAKAETMKSVVVTLAVQAGDDDRLFGSVTPAQIVTDLGRQGMKFDRRTVDLKAGIKTLGDHQVGIELHPEVQALITVRIVRA